MMVKPTADHYRILGLSTNASLDEVRKAYRKLSLKFHPDKTPNVEDHERFKELGAAYELIRDYIENPEKADPVAPSMNPYGTQHYPQAHHFGQPQYDVPRPYNTEYSKNYFSTSTSSNTTSRPSGAGNGFPYYNMFNRYGEEAHQRKDFQERSAHFERIRREMLERDRASEAQRKKEAEEVIKRRLEEAQRRKEAARRINEVRASIHDAYEANLAEAAKRMTEEQTKKEAERRKKKQTSTTPEEELHERELYVKDKVASTQKSSDRMPDDDAEDDDDDDDYDPTYVNASSLPHVAWQSNGENQNPSGTTVRDVDDQVNVKLSNSETTTDNERVNGTRVSDPILVSDSEIEPTFQEDDEDDQDEYDSMDNRSTIPSSRRHWSLSNSQNKRRRFNIDESNNSGASSSDAIVLEEDLNQKNRIIPDIILLLDDDEGEEENNITNTSMGNVPLSSLDNSIDKGRMKTEYMTPPDVQTAKQDADSNYDPSKSAKNDEMDADEYIPSVPNIKHGNDGLNMGKQNKNEKDKTTDSSSGRINTDEISDVPTPVNATLDQLAYGHTRPHPTTPHKRSKVATNGGAFNMNDLESKLGKDIEEVDFNDLYESLPSHGKRLPTLNNVTKHKKRVYAYSDGFSRAETLATPLNKNSVRGHSAKRKLTTLDMHASKDIRRLVAPTAPHMVIHPSVSKPDWQSYVNAIFRYQREFMEYKRLIVQYQSERIQKDFENFNLINDDGITENFDIYTECLQQDYIVMNEFIEASRQFGNTITAYQQVRQWIQTFKLNDPEWN